MRYVIGLTGAIACGKSTISRILSGLGARIIDADRIGHAVLRKGQGAYEPVVKAFGRQILDAHGEIDRKILGPLVFSSKEKLQELNSLTHPHIINNIVKQISANDGIMVLDAALLFETRLDAFCDEIWYVWAKKELQLERVMQRDALSKEEALRRIESQKGDPAKKKKARLIDNSGSPRELEREVKRLYRQVENICAEKRRKS